MSQPLTPYIAAAFSTHEPEAPKGSTEGSRRGPVPEPSTAAKAEDVAITALRKQLMAYQAAEESSLEKVMWERQLSRKAASLNLSDL